MTQTLRWLIIAFLVTGISNPAYAVTVDHLLEEKRRTGIIPSEYDPQKEARKRDVMEHMNFILNVLSHNPTQPFSGTSYLKLPELKIVRLDNLVQIYRMINQALLGPPQSSFEDF